MSTPYLFQRQWKLTLLPRGASIASTYVSNPDVGYPLQMQFDVKRTLHSASNKATFRLFNLDSSQRAILDVGTRVLLECGYGASWTDYASRVYLGDVAKKTGKMEGPDFVVELECGDAELQLQQSFVQAEFATATPLSTIVASIAKQLNVTIAGQIYSYENKVIQRLPSVNVERFCYSGPARQALDQLLKDRGIQWSFQNGELLVQGNQGIIFVVATRLSADTGLIERPMRSDQGVAFRCLIQASIEPGAAVALESAEPNVTGNYRVVECQYKGDTNGGDWAIEVLAEPLGNLLAPYTEKTTQQNPDDAVDAETQAEDMEAAL